MENPEVLCARRLIEIRKLTPPIDIEELIRKYAELEYADIPFEVDGICLNLKVPGKTKVIINRNISSARKIFTTAHELGHIIIPWHVGSIIDEDIFRDPSYESFIYKIQEAEANRFASEILMPMHWVSDLFQSMQDPREITRYIIEKSGVSAQAIMLKLKEALPPGFIYVRAKGEQVLWSGKTRGTISDAPPVTRITDLANFFPNAQRSWFFSQGGEDYYWWLMGGQKVPAGLTQGDWRETLETIFESVIFRDADQKKVWSSLNALLAAANGRVRKADMDAIYDALLQKMDSRADSSFEIRQIVNHPRFKEFLVQKSASFLERRISNTQ